MRITGRQELQAEIVRFFSDTLGKEVPSPTTDLFKTGILDSQSFIELLVHLERSLEEPIGLDNLDIDNFRCIEKMATLLSERKASAKPANS
jgi:acyl carrier protein